MKGFDAGKSLLLCVFTLVFSYGFLAVTAVSQETPAPPQEGAMDKMHQEMMAKWQEYATPGESHKALDYFVGNWDYTIKMWHTADSEPEVSKGTGEGKWILGGRYLKQKAQGMVMGQEFEGLGIMGYDNAKKEYLTVWIDNMGTGIMTGTGTYDAAAKTFEDKGTFSCPTEDDKDKPYRTVTTINSPDQYTFEMYADGMDGKEMRMMEIVYTRKK